MDQNCENKVCPNSEEFLKFFNSVHVALQNEHNQPKAYKEFISRQFHEANSINQHESEDHDKASSGKQDRCNQLTSVSCQDLVADFSFLSMSKVRLHWYL